MIFVSKVSKSYGNIQALNEVSLTIQKGEIVGILGPNGAGKTTLIKIITGYLQPDSGSVMVEDQDILNNTEIIQKRIGYLPENAPLYPELMVQEYLQMMCDLRQIPPEEQLSAIRDAVNSVKIEDVLTRKIGQLSKGMRQRVGLAQAIIHKPEILILDEPTVGLDPTQIVEIRQLIKRISKHSTVLFSTHILSEVEAICDRVVIIMNGKIKTDSSLSEISNTNNAILVLDQEFANVIQDLKKIDGVTGVTLQSKPGELGVYYIEGKSKSDLTPQIYRLAAEKQWPVRELKRDVRTLENVFNELAIAS
ncbi:MAG: ABC transporter ATP-binding protein [Anaerolineaceae bacterium]